MDEVDDRTYHVVRNAEEQYSIWFVERDIPPGWEPTGFTGKKAECLDHVNQVWTDMRPLSLRRRMEAAQRLRAAEPLGDDAPST